MTIRAVFFGTPSFALPTLEALHQSDSINLLGVLTQPDRPSGRGKQLHPPPVKEWALPHDLDLLQPASLKEPEVMSWLERHAPDVIVVVAYGGYVPKTVREMTRFGCDVVLAHPPEFKLMPEIMDMARENARKHKVGFDVVHDMDEAFKDADVVYPKSWGPLVTTTAKEEGKTLIEKYN